jgi:hypothetical protein
MLRQSPDQQLGRAGTRIISRRSGIIDRRGSAPSDSAPHLGVVRSLSDPGVVFLKLAAGLEVVPSPLLLGGQLPGVLSHCDRGRQ